MAIKINEANTYEPIEVKLSKGKTPIAYKNKINELLKQKVFDTKEEAEEWLDNTPIEVEMYYEEGHGLFLVESEAIESATDGLLCSPYTKEPLVHG